MTVLAFAHATARAAARLFARIKSALLRVAAVIAEARIHKARLEAEAFQRRYRLRSKNDDDLPVIL